MAPVMAVSLINDTETEAVLNQLVVPLAKAADIEPERLKIHIVNDDDFNAFVMGGEDVYIYTGLLKEIKNPSVSMREISPLITRSWNRFRQY